MFQTQALSLNIIHVKERKHEVVKAFLSIKIGQKGFYLLYSDAASPSEYFSSQYLQR